MKYLLSTIFFSLSFYLLQGQCSDMDMPCNITNQSAEIVYNDDLETGASSLIAFANNYYQTNFQVNIPTDTTFTITGMGDIQLGINYFTIENIDGLEQTGLELECSNTDCTYYGGSNGCFSLVGTPIETGTYTLNLVVYASGSWNGLPISQTLDDLIQVTLIVENCDELGEDGCYDSFGNFYSIGDIVDYDECNGIECEGPNYWQPFVAEGCEEVCDTVFTTIFETIVETEYVEVIVTDTVIETEYVEVIVTDTVIETEYIEVIVTDTIIAYQEIIEYVDCDTGLPCQQGINELIEKSTTDGKIYNLLGQEIRRRSGFYIEGGEIKYQLN